MAESNEQTIREWLGKLLEIFGWDVRDTSQIIQDKQLPRSARVKLAEIQSTYNIPDYSFISGRKIILFLDAKKLEVNIKTSDSSAYQVRSYGWSSSNPLALLSNFEELSILDTTFIPDNTQVANFGRIYLRIDEYIENFDLIDELLFRENIVKSGLNPFHDKYFKTRLKNIQQSPDNIFANQLSEIRLDLANSILLSNPGIISGNIELLQNIVQIIINRILFIRVCEARMLERDGLLLEFQANDFWLNFNKSSYCDFYNRYDGPLFDIRNEINRLDIPNDVFNKLLSLLYYPSPYKFEVIPTKLLSDIYELFLSKKLIIDQGKVHEVLKDEYIKTKGAISTPTYIIRDIIERSIDKDELVIQNISNILKNKYVDIACGSGTFLVELFDYLESIIVEAYRSTRTTEHARLFYIDNNTIIVNLEGKREIIKNCIYGVDIDEEAVEVARMSLCLKIIDNYNFIQFYSQLGLLGDKILRDVGNNIKCGNSLVESDINSILCLGSSQDEEILDTKPFDYNSEAGFKDIFEINGGFSAVIGNPPYVEVKNYNRDLELMHKYIKAKYKSASNGKVDLAIPFIEKGLSLLNTNGRLGFVIQKRFFKTEYGKNIRKILSKNEAVHTIVDFNSNSIFPGRNTYIAILILSNIKNKNLYYTKIQEEIITENEIAILGAPSGNNSNYLCLPSTLLTENSWNFDAVDLQLLMLEKSKNGTFKKLGIKVGVQVLWDRIYHIKPIKIENKILYGKNAFQENVIIEEDATRGLLCNEKFFPFRKDKPDVYIIFPYKVDKNGVRELSFTQFKKLYPMCAKYLKNNKRKILNAVETCDRKNKWHLFTRVQNHQYIGKKIFFPMTAKYTCASVNLDSIRYCDNANVYFVSVQGKTDDYCYALAGVISSIIFSVMARTIANPQMGGYYKFNKQFLDPLPFPMKKFSMNSDDIQSNLADIAKKIEKIQNSYGTQTPGKKALLKKYLKNYWSKLDELVFDLYELDVEWREYFKEKGKDIDRISILDEVQ